MAVRQLYPSKFLDCWPRLKELRRQSAKEMWTANQRGELLAMGVPARGNTIMAGFGKFHFSGGLGPNFTRIIEDPELHRRCLQATDAAGFGADTCGALKVTLGAMMIGEFAVSRTGEVMKSDFIWDVAMCQSQPKCAQLWQEQNPELPIIATELPTTRVGKDYLISQWQEAIEGISKATGREYDDELLIKGVRNEFEIRHHWGEIILWQQTIPAPLNQRWMYSMQALGMRTGDCRDENVEFFRMARDEVADRVKNGIAALAYERCRLSHEGIPAFYNSPILQYPNRFGAIFIGGFSMFAGRGIWVLDGDGRYRVGPTLEELCPPLRTRDDALEALARLYLGFVPSAQLHFGERVAGVARVTEQWGVNAVALGCSRECRGNSLAVQETAQGVRAKGVPVIIYENAPGNPLAFDVPRYKADMDALLESMGLEPIDGYVPTEPPEYHDF